MPCSGSAFYRPVAALALGTPLLTVLAPAPAHAATLPAHEPIDLLLVTDEVNPHGLSDQELTQPEDVEAALSDPNNGLNVGSLVHVPSGDLTNAISAFDAGQVDVLVYFAHRSGSGQEAFTAAVEQHLIDGGGVVVFHHGMYTWDGKEPILQLLGVSCNSVLWSTGSGQTVVNVGGDHFVSTNGLTYGAMTSIEGSSTGVAAGSYPSFTNLPDELYPSTNILSAADELRTWLFVGVSGDTNAEIPLGYDLRRPQWSGHVVAYQPGEYQPNALDVDGTNFQVLANAIYYAATQQDEPIPGGDDDGSGDADGSTSDAGETTSADADDDADPTNPESTSGVTSNADADAGADTLADTSAGMTSGTTGGAGADTMSQTPQTASQGTADDTGAPDDGSASVGEQSEASGETASAEASAEAGCNCSTSGSKSGDWGAPLAWGLGLLWLGWRRRARAGRTTT